MLPSPSPHLASTKLFIMLSVVTGFISAFINPLMSYFLVDELALPPMYIGLYSVSITISGLLISQWFGDLADNGKSTRKLYLLATTGTVLALLIYMNTSSFTVILLTAIFLMAFGSATVPQTLTMSRQWAEGSKVNIVQFNARIRACFSFAWMLAPPLGFMIVASVGFLGAYSLAILFAVVGMLFVIFLVPETTLQHDKEQMAPPTKTPLSFWCLGSAVVMGAASNTMYGTALPLYTLNELKLPSYTPGILMGLVAGLEIPVMLFTTRLSRVIAKKTIMFMSFIFAIIFYIGIFISTELWHFFALQIFNALFYGLYAGIGLTLMQEQIPKRIGFTSAFYSNGLKVGLMIGSTGTGVIAQYFSFQHASIGSAVFAMFGGGFLLIYGWLKGKESD